MMNKRGNELRPLHLPYTLTRSETWHRKQFTTDFLENLGGRGSANVGGVSGENIVAMCDVDEKAAGGGFDWDAAAFKASGNDRIEQYLILDFRKGWKVDAV